MENENTFSIYNLPLQQPDWTSVVPPIIQHQPACNDSLEQYQARDSSMFAELNENQDCQPLTQYELQTLQIHQGLDPIERVDQTQIMKCNHFLHDSTKSHTSTLSPQVYQALQLSNYAPLVNPHIPAASAHDQPKPWQSDTGMNFADFTLEVTTVGNNPNPDLQHQYRSPVDFGVFDAESREGDLSFDSSDQSLTPAVPATLDKLDNQPSSELHCWEHNCNGRLFSTRSNLKRHCKELSRRRPVHRCPCCNAHFSRSTARDVHFWKQSCTRIRRYSNGRERPRPLLFRKEATTS